MVQIDISHFPKLSDPKASAVRQYDWWDFVRLLQKPELATTPKAELPLWSPAVFHSNYRSRPNVQTVSAVCYDVDVDPVPSTNELRMAVRGRLAVAHSSSSATSERPRWRLVIALSRAVTAAEYDRIWEAFASSLPFPVGRQAKDPSRGWFFPREGEDSFFQCLPLEGKPLDVEEWLGRAAPTRSAPRVSLTGAPDDEFAFLEPHKLPESYKEAIAELASICLSACPEKGERHELSMLLAGALVGDGLPSVGPFCRVSHEEVPAIVYLVCEQAGFGALDQKWRNAVRTVQRRRNGEIVQGLTTLKGRFPGVAAGLGARASLQISDFADSSTATIPTEDVQKSIDTDNKNEILNFEYGAWETEPPPVEFLVEGLLPRECVSIWFGRANSFKTWLLYSMALALATGRPWLLKYPTKQCKVGIVDYETGKRNANNRLFKLRAGGVKNLGVASFTALKPNNPEFWKVLAKEKFDIVFIDSLRRSNPGGDENDSGEAIVPLELASEFAELTGTAVVYIHHAKKTSNDGWPEFRGSAAIEDQVDNAFAVKCDESSPSRARVEIKCTKPGDMVAPEPFVAEVLFDDREKTATLQICSEEPRDIRRGKQTTEEIQSAIELALIAGPIATKEKLFEKIGGRRERFKLELKELEATGRIRFVPRVGYALDNDSAREARVIEVVRADFKGIYSTPARLAQAAHVDTQDVQRMLTERIIVRRGGEEGGFIAPE